MQVPSLCAAADQEETTRKEGEDPVSERRPEERQVPEHAPQQGEQRSFKVRRQRSGPTLSSALTQLVTLTHSYPLSHPFSHPAGHFARTLVSTLFP